jgi:LPXTG-motif cell wall-anchored protein
MTQPESERHGSRFTRDIILAGLAWIPLFPSSAPAEPKPAPPVPVAHPRQPDIDKAVERGADVFKKNLDKGIKELGYDWISEKQGGRAGERCYELVLYTLYMAGVSPEDRDFAEALEKILDKPLRRTYEVSLQAVLLEAIDREAYQWRIVQCAQFLLDNQCENGQWSYGEPGPAIAVTRSKTASKPKPAAKPGTESTKAVKRVAVSPRRKGPKTGDNSNSQYALLGLRSCIMAGCLFPPDVLAKAEKAWTELQNEDGGWDYGSEEAPRGKSVGSMTAGGMGALCIALFHQGKNFEKDVRVMKAAAWLEKEFTVSTNPKFPNDGWHYYYLYALERAGMLGRTETFGKREWYNEGVEFLLKAQKKDGTWSGLDREPIVDTCYAILFLRRATKALAKVYTK